MVLGNLYNTNDMMVKHPGRLDANAGHPGRTLDAHLPQSGFVQQTQQRETGRTQKTQDRAGQVSTGCAAGSEMANQHKHARAACTTCLSRLFSSVRTCSPSAFSLSLCSISTFDVHNSVGEPRTGKNKIVGRCSRTQDGKEKQKHKHKNIGS